MKKTKLVALSVGAMTSLLLLSGCGSDDDKNLVTMKNGHITQEEYYDRIKTQQANEQVLQQMIIYKVAEERYGKDVSDKEVQKTFNKMKKTYGDQFDSLLKSNGYTAKSYKEELKDSLAVQKMLKSNIKISDKDLEKAFKDFHPEVEASVIQVTDEKKAKELLDEIKKDKNKFAEIAKKDSIADSASKGGKVKFSSTSTDIPSQVQKVAWDMKDGDISDVITVEQTNPQTYQTVKSYYIIEMDKQSQKGDDYKKYKKQLKEIVENDKLNNPTTVRNIMKKELKAENVKITDKDLQNVLSSLTADLNTKSGK